MKSGTQVLKHDWPHDEHGPVQRLIGPDGHEYEVRFEPITFGRWLLAIYQNEELLFEKVPVIPTGTPVPDGDPAKTEEEIRLAMINLTRMAESIGWTWALDAKPNGKRTVTLHEKGRR